jgi:hypothetical protein
LLSTLTVRPVSNLTTAIPGPFTGFTLEETVATPVNALRSTGSG